MNCKKLLSGLRFIGDLLDGGQVPEIDAGGQVGRVPFDFGEGKTFHSRSIRVRPGFRFIRAASRGPVRVSSFFHSGQTWFQVYSRGFQGAGPRFKFLGESCITQVRKNAWNRVTVKDVQCNPSRFPAGG